MGKIEEHEGKTNSYDYMLDKVLYKIKVIIGIKKFDDTKIFIDTDNKLPDEIALKTVVILITYVIRDDAIFYPQIFLEEVLKLVSY